MTNIFRLSIGNEFYKLYFTAEERDCKDENRGFDQWSHQPPMVIIERCLALFTRFLWRSCII